MKPLLSCLPGAGVCPAVLLALAPAGLAGCSQAPPGSTPPPHVHAGSWRPVDAEGAPSGRVLHTAVFDGARTLVWGGSGACGGSAACGDGAAYDAGSDRWSPLGSAGAPSARYLHTAVWTGQRMLVWGGIGGGGAAGCGPKAGAPCGDGAAYDPAGDTWAALPQVGAPSPRGWHGAVWTGSEMIVWGGENPLDGTLLGDGARLDPATGSWRPTSAIGAPSPRRYFVALWTGEGMIVWGGDSSATKDEGLGDGAIYDPVGDVWKATATARRPSPRWAHTAVWTGEEMIVWGGLGCGRDTAGEPLLCGDGARYEPATDTWRPVAMSGAPTARSGHTAVWTGREMLVWGGGAVQCADGSSGACADGASYDPATDTWTALPSDPGGARSNHTATWTGDAMLVFGGVGAGFSESQRGDGALFVP